MKTTSISFGKTIYSRLKNSAELKTIIGDKIFPIVSEEETKYPYLVFTKSTFTPLYTKTEIGYDLVLVTFTAVAKNYSETCNILEIVRSIFENAHDNYILDMEVSSVTESYLEDAYVLSLVMTALVNSIED